MRSCIKKTFKLVQTYQNDKSILQKKLKHRTQIIYQNFLRPIFLKTKTGTSVCLQCHPGMSNHYKIVISIHWHTLLQNVKILPLWKKSTMNAKLSVPTILAYSHNLCFLHLRWVGAFCKIYQKISLHNGGISS